MTAKPVVFLAFANDRELRSRYLRNLPEEARRLRAKLERAQREGLCELLVRQNVTREEFLAVFQSADYRDRVAVFHYGGHANGYALLLEEESGAGKAAHAEGLADLLGAQRGLRFVFLNGCATEGHARGLLDAGVAAVLVTSQKIRDEAALDVAGYFYASLGSGASLERAYADAKAAMATDRGSAGPGEAAPEHWPWSLYIKEGADERVKGWNLPQAAGDPLFGLPEIPPGDLHECPYRHLQPFGRDHAELFFGRGKDIRALYERVTDPHAAPILLLYGGSGVGKSSLLEAGLIPRLEQTHEVVYRRRNHTRGLWGTLEESLGADGEIPQAVHSRWVEKEKQTGHPLTLILDQVEEVFTRPDPNRPEELRDFLDAVTTLLGDPRTRPQGKLVLGFRKEWKPELEQGLSERELPCSALYLQPLDREGLIEAIAGPIRSQRLQQHYGLSIEEGLSETIADTLRDDPQSPLAPTLQVLLAKLWAAAKEQDSAQLRFDSARYQTLKRKGLLLGDYLDQQLAAIEKQHPQAVQSGLMLDLLAYHTTARGTAEERAEEDLLCAYAHQKHQLRDLIDACQAGYLLLPMEVGGTRLGHDTLSPLIRERFEESDRPGQRARRVLEGRASDWADGKDGTPLDETDLGIVEAGQGGMREWTQAERRLVEASREQRNRRRRLRRLSVAAALLAVMTIIVLAGWSEFQRRQALVAQEAAEEREREAKQERNLAQSRQLAAKATEALTSEPSDIVLGALLAVEALKREQTQEAYQAWFQAMDLLPRDILRLGLNEYARVDALAVSPDGEKLAGIIREGDANPSEESAQVWSVPQGQSLARIEHGGYVGDIAFSPDGAFIATAGLDRIVSVRDATTNVERYRLVHDQPVTAVAFSPDARWLATGDRDGGVRLYDLTNGGLIHQGQQAKGVYRVAFSPAGDLFATGGGDARVRLWRASTGEELHVLEEDSMVDLLAFSGDGSLLATASSESSVIKIWTVATGRLLWNLRHDKEVRDLSFGTSDDLLISASYDKTARVWSMETGDEIQRIEQQKKVVRRARITPDGRYLATLPGAEGGAVLWDLQRPSEPLRELEHVDIWTLEISPDGRLLATVGDDDRLRLWQIETGGLLAEIPVENTQRPKLIFSPDGARLAMANTPVGEYGYLRSEARIWDAAGGDVELRLGSGAQLLTVIDWSADGTRIATGDADGLVTIWNAESGAELLSLKHSGRITQLGFVGGDRQLLTHSTLEPVRDTAHLWDLNTGEELGTVPLGILGGVGPFALSHNRDRLVTSGSDGFRVWDPVSGGETHRFSPEVADDAFALSDDGRRIAWLEGDGRTIQVQGIDSELPVARLSHGSAEVKPYGFKLAPDGTRLASIANHREVWLWDVESQELTARLNPWGVIRKIRFSPDGMFLVTVANVGREGDRSVNNQVVKVWDAASGRLVAELTHEGADDLTVLLLGFSEDGRRVVTTQLASSQRVVTVWDINTGELLARKEWPDSVGLCCLSPDGRIAATHDKERRVVQIRDVPSGAVRVELESAPERLKVAAFSLDGCCFAAAGYGPDVSVWELATGNLLRQLPHEDEIARFAFLSDGRTLITNDHNGVLLAWDLTTGEERYRIGHTHRINPGSFDQAVLSAESPRVATAIGYLAQVWDLANGQQVARLPQQGEIRRIALSADGRRIAIVATEKDAPTKQRIAVVWDIENDRELFRVAHQADIRSLVFSADSKYLAAGSQDHKQVRLWDAGTGEEVARLTHDAKIGDIAFSPEGRHLVVETASHDIWVWDVDKRKRLAQLPHQGQRVSPLAVARDARWLATTVSGKTPRIWGPRSARQELLVIEQKESADDLKLSLDGRVAYVNGDYGVLRAYDLATGRMQFEIETQLQEVALSPAGNELAMRGGGLAPDVEIRDARTGQLRTRLLHGGKVRTMAFGPNGRYLATSAPETWERGVTSTETLRIWDLDTEKAITLADDSVVNQMAFTADGKYLATAEGGYDHFPGDGVQIMKSRYATPPKPVGLFTARLWDAASGRELLRWEHDEAVDQVALGRDGKLLATNDHQNDTPLRLWDTSTGGMVTQIPQPAGEEDIRVGAISPDGRYLVATSYKVALIWDLESLQEVTRRRLDKGVGEVVFSPDGQYLTMESDDIVSLWDWPSNRILARFPAGRNVGDVAFTRDGRHLVTAGINDRKVRVWAWQTDNLIADACARLERNLTREEWRSYVGDEDYRAACEKLPLPDQ